MENSCRTESNTAVACNLDTRTPILHPVVIGANQTSIILDCSSSSSDLDSDTESESERTYLNQLAPIDGSNGVVAPNSNISVEDSNNVIFGTAIHYNGPVTIYQSVTSNTQTHNGRIGYHEQQSAEDVQNVSQQNTIEEQILPKDKLIKPRIIKWVVLVCFVLAVIGAIIGIIVYFEIDGSTEDPEKSKQEQNDDDEKPTSPVPVSPKMYTRTEWGAQDAWNTVKLELPTGLAAVSHTAGNFCNDFSKCAEIVRNLQDAQMLKGEPDIWYNFLIGGDECVYIGRGWDTVNRWGPNHIGITIIGNYIDGDKITLKMVTALRDLLKQGKELGKLDSKYKLVCHSQINELAGPGKNVCDEVAKLEHYYKGPVEI